MALANAMITRFQIFTTLHYDFFLRKRALRFRSEDVFDIADAAEMRKLWFPLATCVVHSYPLLLSLNEKAYRDPEAFKLLTWNVQVPEGHD